MPVRKGYGKSRRCGIGFVLLVTLILALCSCDKNEEPLQNYTFGNVSDYTDGDGYAYKEEINEIYQVVGKKYSRRFPVKGFMRPYAICIWDTSDGGMVACDYTTGTYIYTKEDVSYDSLVLILKKHIKSQ